MPKEKPFMGCIPKIYKKNAENLGLFFWINAQKQIVPTITIEQAIWNYFRFTELEDWDVESARTTYERLQKDYFDDCRS